MKHLILGTAGHIDHGKTALVRALTGIECDTHQEEKRRGITINLGFASMTLPSGDVIGIIDVPGHRDFIHTMVAGASGIDIALLVIAADSGSMPQTREHLQIMQILGVRSGLIAITRIDLVQDDIADMALEEAGELVKGTFLEGSPIVKVSSKTGAGLKLLQDHIAEIAATAKVRPRKEVFRMYIDRIFSVSGFGTVVTGSVLGGQIGFNAQAYLLPSGKELRVRRLERYGKEVAEVTAGDRASMNLTGLSKEEFRRGMMITDRALRTTMLLDAKLQLFAHGRIVGLWSQMLFLMGTYEAQVRVHVLDTNILRSGESALVQIHLPEPCAAQRGDHFVLRSTSGDLTLGGGEVIDPAPLHHRRRPMELIERLHKLATGKLIELVASEIRKHPGGIDLQILANLLNTSRQEIADTMANLPSDIRTFSRGNTVLFITEYRYQELQKSILKVISAFHRRNPLLAHGRTVEELLGLLGLQLSEDSAIMIQTILEHDENQGKLKRVRHTWALSDHTPDAGNSLLPQIELVEQFFIQSDLKVPIIADLERYSSAQGIDTKKLKQILRYLSDKGKLYQIEGVYLHAKVVNMCRSVLLQELAKRPDGLTVAEYRDLINANRKICLHLYALFDSEGLTERMGDVRVITPKGRKMLANE